MTAAKNTEEFVAWTEGILALTQREAPERYTTDEVRRRWLLKHWSALDGVVKQSIGLKDVKMWLVKVNLKLNNKECKDFFQAVSKRGEKLRRIFIFYLFIYLFIYFLLTIRNATCRWIGFSSR